MASTLGYLASPITSGRNAPDSSRSTGEASRTSLEASRRAYYTSQPQLGAERAVYDSLLGKYVSSRSGLNWNGPILGNFGATLGHAQDGVFSTSAPAVVAPEFSVTNTVKQPAIAALANTLTGQAQTQATNTGTTLSNLPALEDINQRSYTSQQAANDPTQVSAQLTASMSAQEKAQRDLSAQQAQRNKDFAAETNTLLAKLSAENADWEAKTNAIGERAGAAAVTNANLIPLATNPHLATTRSGAQPSRVAVALANALLPTQQAISARRYAQVAQIEQPWRQGLFQNDSNLLAANQNLESSFGGNWRSIYQYIQSLKQQAAQMDAASAERFIAQSLALKRVPAEFLSNQVSMAAALQRLDDAATEHLVSQNVDTGQFVTGPSVGFPSPSRNYRPTNPNALPSEVGGDWRSNAGGTRLADGTVINPTTGWVPDWMRNMTQQQLQAWDANNRRVTPIAPSIPFDPNYSRDWETTPAPMAWNPLGASTGDWANEAIY